MNIIFLGNFQWWKTKPQRLSNQGIKQLSKLDTSNLLFVIISLKVLKAAVKLFSNHGLAKNTTSKFKFKKKKKQNRI